MFEKAKNCSMRVYKLCMYKEVPIWCLTTKVFQIIRPFSSSLLNGMYGECQCYAEPLFSFCKVIKRHISNTYVDLSSKKKICNENK